MTGKLMIDSVGGWKKTPELEDRKARLLWYWLGGFMGESSRAWVA